MCPLTCVPLSVPLARSGREIRVEVAEVHADAGVGLRLDTRNYQLVKTFTILSVIIENSVKHYGAAPGHSLPSVINPEINQLRDVALTGEHNSSMY